MIKITMSKNEVADLKKLSNYASKDLSRSYLAQMVYLPKKKTIEVTNGKVLAVVNHEFINSDIIDTLIYKIIIVSVDTIALDQAETGFPVTDRIIPPMADLKQVTSFMNNGKKEVKEIEISKALYKIDLCFNYTYLLNLPTSNNVQVFTSVLNTTNRPLVLIADISLGSFKLIAMPIVKN